MQLDRRMSEIRDAEGVRAKFGVGPASIPDYLALVGDTADGFPGIKGWGAKSTATVLAHYEHLERRSRGQWRNRAKPLGFWTNIFSIGVCAAGGWTSDRSRKSWAH